MDQCGSFRVKPLELQGGIPIFCERDRYVRNYERIAEDHLVAISAGTANPFIDENLWRIVEQSTQDLVRKHVVPGKRILDAGVGLGRVLGPFDDYERHGVDISLSYLQRAKSAGFEVVLARLEALPYHDAYFDAVIACDVLEHVIDLHQVCLEIARVLRPGGTLIIRVPFLDDLNVYLERPHGYEFIHLRSFDVATLRLLWERVFGFEQLEHATVAPYLKGGPRIKVRALPKSSPLRSRLLGMERRRRWSWLFGGRPPHPLDALQSVALLSQEELVKWIYRLRDNHPAVYQEVANELVHGIELNIVFRRPERERDAI